MSIHEHDDIEEVTIAPLEFDDNLLDDWIAGGGVTKQLVIIYGKPHLAAEYAQVEDDIRLAEAAGGGDDGELGGSELGRLKIRRDEIYAEWAASRSRWTVTAITDAVIDGAEQATIDALGEAPIPPKEPAKGSPQSKHDDYAAKLKKFEARDEEWKDRQNAELVLRVVEKIEFADGRFARIGSAEQVLKMRAVYGEFQVLKIIKTAKVGQVMTPELKAPFSLSTSQDDQT